MVRKDAAPFLDVGQEYLSFLAPTMLTGDAQSQFYVTGAEAGLYLRDGDQLRRVVVDSGDELPDVISVAGAPQ